MKVSTTIKYPHVFQIDIPKKDIPPRYSVTFPVSDLPKDVVESCGFEEDGSIVAINLFNPPTVYEENDRYADLKVLFDMADTMNVPRDLLLRDQRVTVEIEPYDFVSNRYGKRYGLRLTSITVSVERLRLP